MAELGIGLVPAHRELRPQELLQLGCNAPPTHLEAEVHLSMLEGALRHHREAEAEAEFRQAQEEEDVDLDAGKWPVYMLSLEKKLKKDPPRRKQFMKKHRMQPS